jgi:hypothetical protein
MIDFDAAQFFIAINGLFGADRHTGRIFAVLAAHRDVKAGVIPFDHMNTRQRRTADPIVLNRTNQFTVPATRAFFRINNHCFLAYHLFPISIMMTFNQD